uniref:Aminotransferase class I/classII large domain-containing protein n=1 Tax=Ciona savignyi TaxID=51511 RepID=H2Z5S4_CIOSA
MSLRTLQKLCKSAIVNYVPNTRVFRRRRISITQVRKMDYPRNDFEDGGLLKPGHYSLQVGAPGPEFLKQIGGYLKVASESLRQTDRFEETLQYGCVAGGYPVREQVAQFLSRQYEQSVNSDNIFITGGASQGLINLIQHYFTHEYKIFIENPTYPVFALRITEEKLMTPVPISMQSDGMDIAELEKQLADLPDVETTARRPFRAAMYLIPTHHNPTGCCYSPEKCRHLVELARKHKLLIICDDVYNVLNYKQDGSGDPTKFEPSPQRMFAYDKPTDPGYQGNVVSNGSFAKIIAPGLRMGWYEAPKHVIQSLRTCYISNSGSGQCFYASHVVSEALKAGFIDQHVQKLRLAHK